MYPKKLFTWPLHVLEKIAASCTIPCSKKLFLRTPFTDDFTILQRTSHSRKNNPHKELSTAGKNNLASQLRLLNTPCLLLLDLRSINSKELDTVSIISPFTSLSSVKFIRVYTVQTHQQIIFCDPTLSVSTKNKVQRQTLAWRSSKISRNSCLDSSSNAFTSSSLTLISVTKKKK